MKPIKPITTARALIFSIITSIPLAVILTISMNIAEGNHQILFNIPNGFPALYQQYAVPLYHYIYGR